jgi:uncharacterized protein GlcG (DUF336 family)/NAD-dependent dihydropyrimidine dehydrogenase PreA subunit
MPYVITELCTRDGACVDVCPVACIHTTPEAAQFYIDPEICIECEQCKIVCPVEAIFLDEELPGEYRPSIEVNAEFFRENKQAAEPVSAEEAVRMVDQARAYASRMGHRIVVAVIDPSGTPVVVSRMEQVDERAVDLALARARTAAAYLVPTDQIARSPIEPAHPALLPEGPGAITSGGGIPIVDGISLLGAIGVAGGATEQADILCSRAGVAAMEKAVH